LVRLTGGNLKGRNVYSSHIEGLRPTTSFFREWIFNVLQNITDIRNVILLDLFAGTGTVSLEFISRGAIKSTCVDSKREMCELIKKSSLSFGVKNILTVNSECLNYLNRIISSGSADFNTIFIDAPYGDFSQSEKVLDQIFSMKDILPEEIIIIIEIPKSNELNIPGDFTIFKSKSSGSTKMEIIRRKFD